MIKLNYILALFIATLQASNASAQSYLYTFEAPVFTLNETTPILNRVANTGAADFTTTFTSFSNVNGFVISTFLTAPLSGMSLNNSGPGANTLTLTFSRPVTALSFGAATGAIANTPDGRVHLDWGSGSQDFNSTTVLPYNLQVSSPSIIFPNPVSGVQISAFTSANTQVSLFLDNLNITAVPEPATVALIGCSLVGLSFAVYRRRMLWRAAEEHLVEQEAAECD